MRSIIADEWNRDCSCVGGDCHRVSSHTAEDRFASAMFHDASFCVALTRQYSTIGAWLYIFGSKLLIRLRIDDAVDGTIIGLSGRPHHFCCSTHLTSLLSCLPPAVPVHFFNGIWGLIAAGLFSRKDLIAIAAYSNPGGRQGWFFTWGKGSDANLLLCQFCAVLFIIGWVVAVMTPFFIALNALNMFRVDPLEEEVGLDISHHRGLGYELSGPSKEEIEEYHAIMAEKNKKVELPTTLSGSTRRLEVSRDDTK